MSRQRVYSADTLAIMERFFVAYEMCRELGLIERVGDFCKSINANPPHFYVQRKHRERGYFEVGWLAPLVRLGVSAEWLLTGQGKILTK